MVNKPTGFWIRFLARVLDIVTMGAIVVGIAFAMMNHDNGNWVFNKPYLFYIWSFIFFVLTSTWFIIVPTFLSSTLWMWILRIKIEFKEARLKSMIVREIFFSLNWIIVMMFITAIINHTLIEKYARTDQSNISYTDWEKVRVGIVTSIGSIFMVVQFIYAMSIFVRGPKKGLHDSQSNTSTVWMNKKIKINKTKGNKTIKPKLVNNNPVEWV